MRYKRLLRLIVALVADPGRAWRRLQNRTEDTQEDLQNFYVVLFCAMVASLLGGLLYGGKIVFVSAFLKAIITGTSFFGGAWAAVYVLTEVLSKKFHFVASKAQRLRVVIYSMFIPLILSMVIDIFPDLTFLKILLVYTAFVVWEAMGKIIFVEEPEQSAFVLWLSAAVVFFPIIIDLLLSGVILSSAL